MSENNLCNRCKREMDLIREDIIKGTKYRLLKCKKCNRQIARAES